MFFFLEGTYHVLWIFVIVGLIMCLPPLILPKWQSFVHNLNKKEIQRRTFLRIVFISSGLGITFIAIMMMTFHAYYLLDINYETFEIEYFMFNMYTFFSFILLPLGCALIGTAEYVRSSAVAKRGNFFLVFIGLFALALAGSFLHDVLYCVTRTNLYTTGVYAGYDLDWWRNVFIVESKDYRMFGFYMLILTTILILYATILLGKHASFLREDNQQSNTSKILLFSALLVIELGIALYVMEYFRIFTFIPEAIATYLGMPGSLIIAHLLGKSLVGDTNATYKYI